MPQSETTYLDVVLGVKVRDLQYKSIEAVIVTVEQFIGTRTYSRCEVTMFRGCFTFCTKRTNIRNMGVPLFCSIAHVSFNSVFLGHHPTGTATTMLERQHYNIRLSVSGLRLGFGRRRRLGDHEVEDKRAVATVRRRVPRRD